MKFGEYLKEYKELKSKLKKEDIREIAADWAENTDKYERIWDQEKNIRSGVKPGMIATSSSGYSVFNIMTSDSGSEPYLIISSYTSPKYGKIYRVNVPRLAVFHMTDDEFEDFKDEIL